MCRNVSLCVATSRNVSQCVAMSRNESQWVAMCRYELQWVVIVLQWVAMTAICRNKWQLVGMFRNVVQCVEMSCNVSQYFQCRFLCFLLTTTYIYLLGWTGRALCADTWLIAQIYHYSPLYVYLCGRTSSATHMYCCNHLAHTYQYSSLYTYAYIRLYTYIPIYYILIPIYT